jgi:hypothetical protein
MPMPQGTYSVRYSDSEGRLYAADWNYWGYKLQWSRSQRSSLGWYPLGPRLDEKAYAALIQHFGLEEFTENLVADDICQMSPRLLANLRRRLESRRDLPRLEIKSQTLGYNGEAELHED